MTFAAVVLVTCAAVFAAFGVWTLVRPAGLADAVGFGAGSPTARVEIRAMYGGLELGIAAALAWAAFGPDPRPALRLTVLMLGGLGLGRLTGLALDPAARRVMWIALAAESGAAVAAGAALAFLPPSTAAAAAGESAMLKRATPVMVVDAIEPGVLPFWVDRLGWEKTTEVHDSTHNRLGFVILVKDGVELMFQTRTSVAEDMAQLAGEPFAGHTPLFLEVTDLAAVQRALAGADVLVQERSTFYGSRETIVRAPYGQIVTFAQFPPAEGR